MLFGGVGRVFSNPVGYLLDDSEHVVPVATDDFSADSIHDIAVTYGENLSVLLGDGARGFLMQPPLSVGLGSTVSCHLNADGIPDLVVSVAFTNPHQLKTYLGTGLGTFNAGPTTTISGAGELTPADLDGDGDCDIAALGSGGLIVALGTGTGSFQGYITYPTGNLPKDVTVVDLNGDLRQDIVVANEVDHSVTVLLAQ